MVWGDIAFTNAHIFVQKEHLKNEKKKHNNSGDEPLAKC